MTTTLRQLWEDDRGAVISVEMILLLAILIFGIIPGLVALRNGINAGYGTMTNAIQGFVPSFTYSGYMIEGLLGPQIAQVGGYSLTNIPTLYLSGSQITPTQLSPFLVLSPAP